MRTKRESIALTMKNFSMVVWYIFIIISKVIIMNYLCLKK
jgi:hypothetical protein